MAAAAAISTTAGAPGGRPRGVAIDIAAGQGLLDGPGREPDLLRQPRRQRRWRESQHRRGHREPRRTRLRSIRPREGSIGPTRTATRISFAKLDNIRRWRSDHGRRDGGRPDRSRRRSRIAERIYWANAGPRNKISFANLDGSGGGDLDTDRRDGEQPTRLGARPVANRIYWANIGPTQNRVT